MPESPICCAPRVLIVDDDAFIRRPLELILRNEGFQPVTATDGESCLARMAEEPPEVVLMDVMMPGRDGFEVCHAIKQDPAMREIPVVLLTGRGEDDDRTRSHEVGASRLLTKPYSPADVIQVVRDLVEQARRRQTA